MLCSSKCKIFRSPNRELYHKLRLHEHKSYPELAAKAKELGEDISMMSFHRHFNKHVSPLEVYRGSPEEERWLEQKARERLDVVREIEELLVLCKRKLEEALRLPANAPNITAVARIVSEIRMTLDYIQKHKATYLGTEKLSEEASISRLIDIIDKEIPDEYKGRVLAKLMEEKG